MKHRVLPQAQGDRQPPPGRVLVIPNTTLSPFAVMVTREQNLPKLETSSHFPGERHPHRPGEEATWWQLEAGPGGSEKEQGDGAEGGTRDTSGPHIQPVHRVRHGSEALQVYRAGSVFLPSIP